MKKVEKVRQYDEKLKIQYLHRILYQIFYIETWKCDFETKKKRLRNSIFFS